MLYRFYCAATANSGGEPCIFSALAERLIAQFARNLEALINAVNM